jgi:tRNA threonylcarbamoyladenosine biosynthesis protein TsaE
MNTSESLLLNFAQNPTQPLRTLSHSCLDTESFGAALAARLLDSASHLPLYIALRGDLGVGKTAFVRGFTSYIAPEALVRSPTFALVNEYRAKGGLPPIFHFDMYRITDEDDLYSIGYDDYLDRGICLVEWSENIPYALPDTYLSLTIEKTSPDHPDERSLTLTLVSDALG